MRISTAGLYKGMMCLGLVALLVSCGAMSAMAVPVVPGGTDPYAWYRADMGVSTVGGGNNSLTK